MAKSSRWAAAMDYCKAKGISPVGDTFTDFCAGYDAASSDRDAWRDWAMKLVRELEGHTRGNNVLAEFEAFKEKQK